MSANVYASIPSENGDLESYLNGITFGTEDDGQFKIPTPAQIVDFENAVNLILQGSYDLASTSAQQLGYELVAYTDTISAKLFYILRETNPIPSLLANGGGTYIFQPAATYNVAIHAPHPRSDLDTNKEAISTFMASDVRYFMMAGSHRRSHPDASTCQNFSDYRPSDAVHNSAHYFYAAHKAMEDFDNTIHYIELHGYGSASFETIASQCDTGGNLAVANLSETLSDDDAGEHTLLHSIESVMNQGNEITACIYSAILDTSPNDKYTQYLGGSTNTLARYTNASPSVCDQVALTANNSHRYVHMEQSRAIRETAQMRELMATYISQGIKDYFGESFEINVGLNDAWFNPLTDGQGFFITVFPDLGAVSLAWFTYDTEPVHADAPSNLGDAGHRWLVALGPIDGNNSVMDITIASGGLFDTATEITEVSDGTIILTFDSCNSGTVVYDITSIGQKGTVPIQRVAYDNIALCEALATPSQPP
ncbi:MAG: hypothetical protein QNK19_13905 [Xanthomonadales bacterium]|nr:hypothetical protein [Xanthomonadales bacterium]